MNEKDADLLREAEELLGGFMGSLSTYHKVEALRERIRERLASSPDEPELVDEDGIGRMADLLFRILEKHSNADNGPWLSDRCNAGTPYDYVTIDGHVALRQMAADLIRELEAE